MKATINKSVQAEIAMVVIIAIFLFSIYPDVKAQNLTSFNSSETFSIPVQNGLIRFATNGSYTSATLQNGTWYFIDLTLGNSSVLGNLTVSVENSNITIYNYFSDQTFNQFNRFALLQYWADGKGIQTFNLGLKDLRSTHQSEWGIVISGTAFLAEGSSWHLYPNNTISIIGQTGNISVAHYGFEAPTESNLPFYIEHSVVLVTAAIVAGTLAVAATISYRARRLTLNGD